ncbi:MAG: glycosyltransferase family 2 protein [Magnetococcales bacterium]|nr:glycosyltransferase family 2 protein [Magnetococcales bacterium]
MQLSVVIPVYRNAGILSELHRRLSLVLVACALRYEILFVHDASPDDSLAVLKRLAAVDPCTTVLDLQHNIGQQMAILLGVDYSQGEWIVIMDGDLQDPPEAIPLLLAKGAQGFAAVFAGRRGRYESRGRLFTSRIFKWLLHHLSGAPLDAGVFVALRREARSFLLRFPARRPWIVAMIALAGLPMAVIPVVRQPRFAGESSYSGWRRLMLGLTAVCTVLAFRWRPAGLPCLRRPGAVPPLRLMGGRACGAAALPDPPGRFHDVPDAP